ncbi:MAG TPA: beta-galactosidase, partial [Clostridia bacterium]
MKYGVSYYPEQKKKEEIKRDIELMIESGINTVRMGEFAWCRFEPEEGVFCFDWLDDVVEELGMAGIDSIICTPTACPPAWLVEKHPDILYVDNRNVIRPFGGRRDCCYNNPVYRKYSRIIAEVIGKHYGNNPYVYAFQIDNELAQEGT